MIQCKGPCKNYYHEECARYKGIIFEGSIQPVAKKGKAAPKKANASNQNMTSENDDGPGEYKESDSNEKKSSESQVQSFLCIYCQRGEAPCYICKKFSPISAQAQAKDKGMGALPGSCNAAKKSYAQMASQGDSGEDHRVPSSGENSTECVEKCIVGSCQKYYHFNCL